MAERKKNVIFRKINGHVVPIVVHGGKLRGENKKLAMKAYRSTTKASNYHEEIRKKYDGTFRRGASWGGALGSAVGFGLSALGKTTPLMGAIVTFGSLATGALIGGGVAAKLERYNKRKARHNAPKEIKKANDVSVHSIRKLLKRGYNVEF